MYREAITRWRACSTKSPFLGKSDLLFLTYGTWRNWECFDSVEVAFRILAVKDWTGETQKWIVHLNIFHGNSNGTEALRLRERDCKRKMFSLTSLCKRCWTLSRLKTQPRYDSDTLFLVWFCSWKWLTVYCRVWLILLCFVFTKHNRINQTLVAAIDCQPFSQHL